MISFNELEKGLVIIINRQPYEILEASHLFKGRGHSVLQAKIKNLITGNIIPKTFHPSDSFEEAQVEKIRVEFLYSHRGQFFFSKQGDPSSRFSLSQEIIGTDNIFLKPNLLVETLLFQNKVINIVLPIKLQLKVIETPPGIKGGRAEPGTKTATLETGAKIAVPLFIKNGDIIEINTETAEYVRRIN